LSLGNWSMVIGNWSMVIGNWSLVNGHWSIVNGQRSLGIWDLKYLSFASFVVFTLGSLWLNRNHGLHRLNTDYSQNNWDLGIVIWNLNFIPRDFIS